MKKGSHNFFLFIGLVCFFSLSSFEALHWLDTGRFIGITLKDISPGSSHNLTAWQEINTLYLWLSTQWVGWVIIAVSVFMTLFASLFSSNENMNWD